jgi:hypothetical protein
VRKDGVKKIVQCGFSISLGNKFAILSSWLLLVLASNRKFAVDRISALPNICIPGQIDSKNVLGDRKACSPITAQEPAPEDGDAGKMEQYPILI